MISENHTICLYDGVTFITINHHDQDFHVLLYIIPQYYSTKTPTTYKSHFHIILPSRNTLYFPQPYMFIHGLCLIIILHLELRIYNVIWLIIKSRFNVKIKCIRIISMMVDQSIICGLWIPGLACFLHHLLQLSKLFVDLVSVYGRSIYPFLWAI